MEKQSLYLLMFVLAASFVPACTAPMSSSEKAMSVIFETDMGNDIDDALALDMLYKYQDEGKIRLLAISNNKNSAYSIPFLEIMNTWYGYPETPLGTVVNGADSEGDAKNYAQAVCEYTKEGKTVFEGSSDDVKQVPESVTLYRKLLSQQPDSSVVLISVGFSTNIRRLLESTADAYSELNGKELVARKIKLLSIMAGSFNGQIEGSEYNIAKDIEAARKVFSEWPTPIVASPFEVGVSILYPGSSIENDFSWAAEHPLVVAYKSYLEMPYDRPTWDLTAVLYAVEGKGSYFGWSKPGKISVDGEGSSYFDEEPSGKHRYLTVDSMQAEMVKNHFINIITKRPKKYENE